MVVQGDGRTDSCRPAASQCVCELPSRTMCSALSMTKCQCKKPPAQSAPLCRGTPRSTFAVRLAALRHNNTLPLPEQEIRQLPFSLYLLFWQYVIYFSPPHPPTTPVDFSVMSSLRTQANVNTCKLLRNAPPTQSGRWIQPQPANTANTVVSLYLFCLVSMQSSSVQSLHHSQASVSLPVSPTSLYLDAREDLGLLIRVCFPLFAVLVFAFPVEVYCHALRNKMHLSCAAAPTL